MSSKLCFDPETPEGKWNHLLFDVTFNVDYHRRRRAHYEWISKTADTLVMLSATIIFGQLAGFLNKSTEAGEYIVALVTFVIMALSVIKYFFEFDKKARMHDAAYRSFLEIRRDMELSEHSKESIASFSAKRYGIYLDEGAVFLFVSWMAHNAALDGIGAETSPHIEINWWQRLIAHYWRATHITPKMYKPSLPDKVPG